MVSQRRKAKSRSCLIFFAQGNTVSLLQWGDNAKVLAETRPTPKSSTTAPMSPFWVWTHFFFGRTITSHSKTYQAVLSQRLKSSELRSGLITYQHNVVYYLTTAPSHYWSTSPNKPEQSVKTAARACKTSWNKLTDEEMQPGTSTAPDMLKSTN